MLLLLLLSLTGCLTRTIKVPVAAPKVTCTLPDWPDLPQILAKEGPGYIMIELESAKALGLWVTDARAWHKVANACLAAQ